MPNGLKKKNTNETNVVRGARWIVLGFVCQSIGFIDAVLVLLLT
jgi:hypothetical protein